MLDLAAVLFVLTALMAYFNHRFIKLPMLIGVMAIALLLSIALVSLDAIGIDLPRAYEKSLVSSVDFSALLMDGMLSFLLFAGALHVDLGRLRNYRWQVGLLAAAGTVISAAAIGFSSWYLLPLASVSLPLTYCLVFGALISPTDPIAVTGILKSSGAPESVDTVISGESLFNDGVGVALFSLVMEVVRSGDEPTWGHALFLLLREAPGGIVFGAVLGYVVFYLLKSIDSYEEEVLLTLATVVGGYALAQHLHVSGPLTMVVAGVIIGNQGRAYAMSDKTRGYIDMFWEMLDAILNAVLFVLIGLEAVVITISVDLLKAGAAVILLVLLVRLAAVGAPVAAFHRALRLPQGAWKIMTWGGLRGGISVALALSLPAGSERDIIVTLTYIVVAFAILVQGLTIGKVVKISVPCKPETAGQDQQKRRQG